MDRLDRVLLVDDDAALRALLGRILQDRGFEVALAGSVAEARVRFTESRPRVAIVDGVLPDGSGVALLEELRARDDEVALVWISAYLPDAEELARIAGAARVAAVLAKPFAPEELLEAVLPELAPPAGEPDPEAIMLELRAEYVTTLDEQVRDLEIAHAAGDVDRVRRLAHRMHGTAGTYGLDAVSAAAGAIEAAIPGGEARLGPLVAALRSSVRAR